MERFMVGIALAVLSGVLSQVPQVQTGPEPTAVVDDNPFRPQLTQLFTALDQLPTPAEDTAGAPPAPAPVQAEVQDKVDQAVVQSYQTVTGLEERITTVLNQQEITQRELQAAAKAIQDSTVAVNTKVERFISTYQPAIAQEDFDTLKAKVADLEAKLAALDARCQCGKTASQAAPAAAPVKSGGSNGGGSVSMAQPVAQPVYGSYSYSPVVSSSSGGSSGSVSYSQPVYQAVSAPAPVYLESPQPRRTVQTTQMEYQVQAPVVSGGCYQDANGNMVCPTTGQPINVQSTTTTRTRQPLLPWRR